MFENAYVGQTDCYGHQICEGDRLIFKSFLYKGREFEGTVRYNKGCCAFIIERDNDEGNFGFTADIYDIVKIG